MLAARELQQIFQNTQRSVDGNHQRFVPDRLGDVPPEFGGGSYLMRLVIYLVWGLVKADLRVEMFSPEVRSGWVLVPL